MYTQLDKTKTMSEQRPSPLQHPARTGIAAAGLAVAGLVGGAQPLAREASPAAAPAIEQFQPDLPAPHPLPQLGGEHQKASRHTHRTPPTSVELPHAAPAPSQPAPAAEHWQPVHVRERAARPVISPPQPVPPTEKPSVVPPEHKQSIDISALTVPAEAAKAMADTVYLPWSRCSGFLVRDAGGEAVGYASAEHCGLLDTAGPAAAEDYRHTRRIKGTDGNYYIVIAQPAVVAETGETQKNLQPVGSVDAMILPPSGNTSHDLALGVFAGHTPEEVLAAYNQNRLSDDMLAALKTGDVVYSSAWPVDQPKSPVGETRQQFAQAFLGLTWDSFDTGQSIDNMAVTAMPKDADGAICSPGASGSEAFVQTADGPRSLGTLTGYVDLNGVLFGTPESAQAQRQYYSDLFGVDLDQMDSLCFYSLDPPTLDGDASVVKVVNSIDQIPGHEGEITPERELQKARQAFTDPATPKTILDGYLYVPATKGGDTWIDRPMLYHDAANGAVVLAYADPGDPDHLALSLYPSLDSALFRAHSGAGGIALLNSIGADQFQPDPSGTTYGQLVDSNRLVFGGLYNGEPENMGDLYRLSFNPDGTINSQLSLKGGVVE